jgi:tetratricopeptide (TPR) repeat protein
MEAGKANDYSGTCLIGPLRVKNRVSQKTFSGQMFNRGRMPPVWQGGLIVLLVFLAYLPALHGGFVWDDDSWTTNLSALFQDTSGLHLIWFQPTALQQYYPLSGTTFWLDYQLWKFWTTPYHVENVLLHALAALLFWRLLLRLRVPGAWLASAIFALHPVMVESVAWITERKNVLSLVLYLGAWLAYLRYKQNVTGGPPSSDFRLRRAPARQVGAASGPYASRFTGHSTLFYGLAFVLFLCALLAKTTAFSLPAAILLIGWWQRGQIRWRADVLPTLPFFALALGLCAVTAWLEEYYLCAQGSDFDLTFPQRCLIAGRVFWFYPGKLLWPAKLCFVYPRWQPDPGSGWQWLQPATAIGILFTLWLARKRIGRGPATALFFYVGTLFPVLGFMNAYGMRYSFVWDHWVYLSALGIIALAAALVVRVAESLRTPAVVYGFAAIVLPVLALLTWRQAGTYTDMETLWRQTLARNPDCWLAHNNLGLLLDDEGHMEEAMEHYHKAIQLNPNFSEVRNNLGRALADQGRFDEAMVNFRKAIQIDPNNFKALDNLGIALADQGRFDEAMANYFKAIQINPNYCEAQYNLGAALTAQGRFDKAMESFRKAIQINPNYAKALNNLAWMLAASPDDELRNGAEAVRLAERACELTHYGKPVCIGTLAAAYAECGRFPEAVATAEKAEQLATTAGLTAIAAKNRQLLELYRAGKPYHEPAPTGY